MAPPRSRCRQLGSALLAAAAIAALPASAGAYTGEGTFFPETSAPVFPGTNTVKDGWRLMGQSPATQVLIAPRWVLSTKHSVAEPPTGYNNAELTVGSKAIIIDAFTPKQAYDDTGDYWAQQLPNEGGTADISLALLDRPMPAPADGFPKLMSDDITPDLAGALPGATLWNGMGTTWIENFGTDDAIVHPQAGWTHPDGRPIDGVSTVKSAGGDSGSTGLWYPTATSRPVISSAMTTVVFNPTWGIGARFSGRLMPSQTENYATISDWIKAVVAKEQAAAQSRGEQLAGPEWTTLANENAAPSQLPPPAPRNIRVRDASATSITVAWDRSNETRIPIDGYRVTASPGGTTVSVDGTTNSATVEGLATGTAYTIQVQSYNGNGTSNPQRQDPSAGVGNEPQSIEVTPHADPTTQLLDAQVTAAMQPRFVNKQLVVDYCATASWTMPAAPAGEAYTGLRLQFGDEEVAAAPTAATGRYGAVPTKYAIVNGQGKFKVCGLIPGRTYGVTFNTVWDTQTGPTVLRAPKVPAGAAPGTILPAATALELVPYRAITNDKADYCVRARWTAPAAVAGAPVQYRLIGTISGVEFADLLTSNTNYQRCGLEASRPVDVTLVTRYAGVDAALDSVQATTLTGAPLGTAVPRPTSPSLTVGPANNAGTVDYCITATWQLADLAGFTRIDSAGAWNADASSTAEAAVTASGTSRTSKLCGLQPGTAYTVSAGVIYTNGSFVPYEATATITTPSGAAPGTEWEAPNNLRVTQQLVNGQRCATLLWSAPAPVDGFPVQSYNAYLTTDDGSYGASAAALSPYQGTKQFCGLPASTPITATVQARYRQSILANSSVAFTSNA